MLAELGGAHRVPRGRTQLAERLSANRWRAVMIRDLPPRPPPQPPLNGQAAESGTRLEFQASENADVRPMAAPRVFEQGSEGTPGVAGAGRGKER